MNPFLKAYPDEQGPENHRRIYTPGQRVEVHGEVGFILGESLPGVWEVRLNRGDLVVSWRDINPLAHR